MTALLTLGGIIILAIFGLIVYANTRKGGKQDDGHCYHSNPRK